MSVNQKKYEEVKNEIGDEVRLIAVSKSKPAEDIAELYKLGHRDFGENYVQELIDKYNLLPKDIHWHFIGHLQSNKVKNISSFISLIHGVDSFSLLKEINKHGKKAGRIINCLLQVHIAREETKFGMSAEELNYVISQCKNEALENINIKGLMGIASFTDEIEKVRSEFTSLKNLCDKYSKWSAPNFNLSILSMGMSSDYKIAVEEGSNMVRIGSLIFGERQYNH